MQDQQYAIYKIKKISFIFSFMDLLKNIVLSMLSFSQFRRTVVSSRGNIIDIIPKYANVDFSFIFLGKKTLKDK